MYIYMCIYIYTYVDIHTEVTNKFHRGSGDHESLEILQEFCEIQSTQNQKSKEHLRTP